jgi:dynein heavy chain, axonemal
MCCSLLECIQVCHTQLQFGSQRPLPVFGGTNGEAVRQSVQDICVAYKGRVEVLAAGGYPILDARVTRWHDDFNAFRAHVKDLEEMLIKATDHALASVSCLQDRIVLIEALQVRYAVLSSIRVIKSFNRASHFW